MINISFEKENSRAVATDNNIIIGQCNFTVKGDTWNIVHTVVNSNYQGQGIAKSLVTSVIKNAQKENKKVIASCSYAKRILTNK